MENMIKIFESEEFGQIRTVIKKRRTVVCACRCMQSA